MKNSLLQVHGINQYLFIECQVSLKVSYDLTNFINIMFIKEFPEFVTKTEELVQDDPKRTKIVLKYSIKENFMHIKVTNERKTFKTRFYSKENLKDLEIFLKGCAKILSNFKEDLKELKK